VPTNVDAADAPATSPPLSAAPGGVTTDQRADPGAAWSTCQKVLTGSDSWPMGRTVHEPPAVSVALGSGASPDEAADAGVAPTPMAATQRRSHAATVGNAVRRENGILTN
jgi:hypothetical protein